MNRRPFYYLKNEKKQPVVDTPILTPEYIETVRSKSYLGKKGYTIPKLVLKKEDEDFLRKDLFVRPMVFGVCAPTTDAFPVFRENANKFYLPRFYGIKRYGFPDTCEIESGANISVEFTKPLRDYQDKIIDVYMKYVNSPICKGSEVCGNGGGGILEVPCGRGKCLGKDTPILMYDGSIKMVQDIVVGDKIMGDDSLPRNVLTLARGKEMMYKVSTQKGDGYVVNESHILSLKHEMTGETLDISIQKYLDHPEREYLLGYRVPIDFPEMPLNIDPYTYGIQLDKHNGLWIPEKYLHNSRENRLKLLAGMLDKMASGNKSSYSILIPPNSVFVIESLLYLCRSLGFDVSICYEFSFTFINLKSTEIINLAEIPTRILELKDYKNVALEMGTLTYKINVRILEEGDYYGFEIDGNRRFVLGDFTVTHNTVMALKIISLIKKRTLILVHKEFLMNQWIERIGEFLPGARVGKIQAAVFDIENKDIVIGMIQTLYDKEYASGTFDSFGLTIIDEVHRIGSEQFSRTLFKTITPYMLGISATVDRKDKLTNVLYMFIGDKIYEEKRENDDAVCVRAITYQTNDSAFNEVEVDFRGNTKYSSMIVKLCEYGPRSDFIVRVLGDLLEEEPENQIMILCHNRSLLTYLFESITHRNLTTVGFYVGGMKQDKLQETEKKQIVLATYAMAAEALDIKTLSTLVMVTPKTDITQSIGRILRVKHANPIVVDIVDAHEIFQNQWAQRRRFYKKCNYRIRLIDSSKYAGMAIDWSTDKSWKWSYEPKEGALCGNEDKNEHKEVVEEAKKIKCMIDPAMFAGL
jgi:hypothetical protein